jgi:hypothetical protein
MQLQGNQRVKVDRKIVHAESQQGLKICHTVLMKRKVVCSVRWLPLVRRAPNVDRNRFKLAGGMMSAKS